MELSKNNCRQVWVDNVKVIACILVVLCHFVQSMVKSNIIGDYYIIDSINKAIYYFHMPLFFICSGYLYQKFSKVYTFKSWGRNVLKKFLALGIPYFTFATFSWAIKVVFSSQVNNQAGGFVDNIFLNPVSPYWFLYALFFIFVFTPSFKSIKVARVSIVLAVLLRIALILLRGHLALVPYFVIKIMEYELWFVIGMYIALANIDIKAMSNKKYFNIAVVCGILFVIFSTLVAIFNIDYEILGVLLGALACFAVVFVIGYIYRNNEQNAFFEFMTKYTMPLFLMHTIFAATLRSLLFKIGIQSSFLHILLGLIITFAGPIIAGIIMKKTKILDFFLYPTRFIKIKL